jgi:hypothetical protein
MCAAGGLWGQTGVVIGRKKRYEPGKHPIVVVFMNGQKRLFEFCSLDVVSEGR